MVCCNTQASAGRCRSSRKRTGSITTEDKGFDFSVTLGDDFKIAKDRKTQKKLLKSNFKVLNTIKA